MLTRLASVAWLFGRAQTQIQLPAISSLFPLTFKYFLIRLSFYALQLKPFMLWDISEQTTEVPQQTTPAVAHESTKGSLLARQFTNLIGVVVIVQVLAKVLVRQRSLGGGLFAFAFADNFVWRARAAE